MKIFIFRFKCRLVLEKAEKFVRKTKRAAESRSSSNIICFQAVCEKGRLSLKRRVTGRLIEQFEIHLTRKAG